MRADLSSGMHTREPATRGKPRGAVAQVSAHDGFHLMQRLFSNAMLTGGNRAWVAQPDVAGKVRGVGPGEPR